MQSLFSTACGEDIPDGPWEACTILCQQVDYHAKMSACTHLEGIWPNQHTHVPLLVGADARQR